VADFPSEQYRNELTDFRHRYREFSFKKAPLSDVKEVARLVAEDMTERFTMGVFIPRDAPINFRGQYEFIICVYVFLNKQF